MPFKDRLTPRRAAIVAVALIALVLGIVAWQLLVPHRYESSAPLTLAQAKRHSPIALPASAANIRIATFRHFQQTVQYVRFEAPVADCLTHAQLLVPDSTPTGADYTADMSFTPFNPGAFRDMSPFDLRTVKNGVQYGTGGPGQPRVCVDKDRGTFFYYLTD